MKYVEFDHDSVVKSDDDFNSIQLENTTISSDDKESDNICNMIFYGIHCFNFSSKTTLYRKRARY